MIVRQGLDDHRNLVGGVSVKDNVFQGKLFFAGARAFFNGAFDGITSDTFSPRFFHGRRQTGICIRISPAELGGNHDFTDEFRGRLRFFQRGDRPFCVEPLSSHA